MNIDKQIIVDLYEVIKSQNAVISFLVANDHALVNTLANSPSVPYFADAFHNQQTYAATHPTGQLAESLVELQRMLFAIGEKLKQDTGGWTV